ncbi:6-phosphogluconolactonase [Undibacterium sp.]|jgi:6-phosphogluconolactonase|uniref:6-phosphogluconolactonase n=1 Tax=Undibacterium sp. TaxID=1914977 RepID=UPI002BB92702|nr:6-phosphogluconolactonase [Undibacterium sp.]HTD05038.1 6-phosphogluconolactonase [Undibacterium sp.]
MLNLHEYPDFASLSAALSAQWLGIIQAKPASSFALAGGTTPAPVYRQLDALLTASPATADKIKLVATDERWVSDADPQSNEGLFRQCLEQSNHNAQRWQLISLKTPDATPGDAIPAVASRLAEQLPDAFDAILLGMGADGHIASLFPGSPHLLVNNPASLCVPATHPQSGQARISLSLSRLVNTDRIWLVISGRDKRQVLENAAAGNLPIGALLREASCPIDVFWSP